MNDRIMPVPRGDRLVSLCPCGCGGVYDRDTDDTVPTSNPLAVLAPRDRPRDYLVTLTAGFSRRYDYLVTATSRRDAIRIAQHDAGLHGSPWKYRARPAKPTDHGYRIEETR